MPHVLAHIRHNAVAYVALFFAVGAGGGYAAASVNKKTIHGCVNIRTHALFVVKRCGRGEVPLVWNQQGRQGATGRPGVSPVTAWTVVGGAGSTAGGHGFTVQHTGHRDLPPLGDAGAVRRVPVSPPVVTVSDSNPPAGQAAGAFPVAWVGDGVGSTFIVTTGVVVSGTFSPADLTFNVQESCS